MAHIAESVALTDIDRIENYINKEGLTVGQILQRTGADWCLNSILYNRDGSPCSHLKVDGEVKNCPNYTAWGLAWDRGPDIHVAKLPANGDLRERNFIGGVTLVLGGEAVDKPIYDQAQGGTRGRTAWGLKPGRFCAYCSKDGSGDARTPEQLRDLLEGYGWEFATMGDCGGSSQAILNDRSIQSGRVVKYLMLVYLKKNDILGGGYEPSVKGYFLGEDRNTKLSEHFKVKEFACRDGSEPVLVSPALVTVLEAVREHFGKPVRINSGYRNPAYNKKVGGKPRSQHTIGTAADVSVSGVSPEDVARFVRTIMPHHGGVGIYKTFTHIDVRKKRADWRG